MKITILASVMIMAGYFLLLYGAAAFIQDKRFFTSAPKELYVLIPEKRPERFRGAHVVGWMIVVFALLLFAGALALSVWDGIRSDFGFSAYLGRFLVMLYAMEIYDIVFFDWVLLCHSNFFPRYCPEVKGVIGPHLFGFNKREHILHFVLYLPICAALAWVCSLF